MTRSVLLSFVNVAVLAGSMEKRLPPELTEVCWQNVAGAAEPNRTAATPPSMT